MTSRVDLREFRSAYIAEVDELLTLTGARLLAIEEAGRAGSSPTRDLRDLMRALHTIKGLSAMVAVEPVVTIAHRMEAVVKAADQAGVQIDERSLEALHEGARAIALRVRAVADGQTPAEPPLALLRSFDGLELGEVAPSTFAGETLDPGADVAPKIDEPTRAALLQGLARGARALRVDFAPSAERAEGGLTITTVRARLLQLGEIIRVVPLRVLPSPEAPGGLSFAILLLTTANDPAVADAAACEPAAIRVVGVPRGALTTETSADDTEALEPIENPWRHGVLRVEASRVDEAMDTLSALVVTRSRLAGIVATLAASGAGIGPLVAALADQSRQLRDLRGAILRFRMVAIAEIFDRLPLIMRGLRRATGKTVRLVLDGGTAELDKAVAERIFPALVHLVRNAVDHGVEARARREASGKAGEAEVRVACFTRSSRSLEVVVSDDGQGIDREAVARRAGVSASSLADARALLDALCRPGLSTRDEVSSTSGRGVGMDAVRRIVVDQLGGELTMSTEPGRGTTFTVVVPLTIAVVDAFTLSSSGDRFVVPVPMVEEVVLLDPARLVEVPTRGGGSVAMLRRRGEAVPLVALAHALGMAEIEPGRQAIVVRRGQDTVAFGIDRVLGQQESVVRPLEDPLVRVPGVSGTTDLGDGRATLVLDVLALAGLVADRGRAA